MEIETKEVLDYAQKLFIQICEDDELNKITVKQLYDLAFANVYIQKKEEQKEKVLTPYEIMKHAGFIHPNT